MANRTKAPKRLTKRSGASSSASSDQRKAERRTAKGPGRKLHEKLYGDRRADLQVVYERPPLYPEQLAAIYTPKRYSLIEASTKAGKTFGCLAWLLEQALKAEQPGRVFWWVAPVSEQTRIAWSRLKMQLEPRDELLNPNETLMRTTLRSSGSIIAFKSADHPDSLYGDDVWAMVIDEATRCKGEAWAACRSTLTKTRGHVRIIGNVKGRKNWAYSLARQAQQEATDPSSDMHYALLTAEHAIKAGIFPREELEDARRRLPPDVFRQLYFGEPSDDEGNPFGMAAIERNILKGVDGGNSWSSGARVMSWGIDLAESVDYNVAIGLDAGGCTARFERWQSPWPQTKARILDLVDAYTPALIDDTGVGRSVVEDLQLVRGTIKGYTFTPASKQVLMGGLASALQSDSVQYPDGVIPSELRSFEYVYREHGVRYQAMEGCHDDTVIALSLAVHGQRPGPGSGFLAHIRSEKEKRENPQPEQSYRDMVTEHRGGKGIKAPPPKKPDNPVHDDRGEQPPECKHCGRQGTMRFRGSKWQCFQCGANAE